jgi:hypothetical protein
MKVLPTVMKKFRKEEGHITRDKKFGGLTG